MPARLTGGTPVSFCFWISFEFQQVFTGGAHDQSKRCDNQDEKERKDHFAHELADMEKEGCAGSIESSEPTWKYSAASCCRQSWNPPPPPCLGVPPFVAAQGPDQAKHGSNHGSELEPFDGVFFELQFHEINREWG